MEKKNAEEAKKKQRKEFGGDGILCRQIGVSNPVGPANHPKVLTVESRFKKVYLIESIIS
jgi:hypothetical protein